jgi:hypothetical protein
MVNAADRKPIFSGVKVTFTVVLLLPLTVIGSAPPVAVKEKSAGFEPLSANPEITSEPAPVLLIVIVVGPLLVPTG